MPACTPTATGSTDLPAAPRLPDRTLEFFAGFCALPVDRPAWLAEYLKQQGIEVRSLVTGRHHHLLVGPALPARGRIKFLVAHHDRVAGTPGANDNSASVWHLADFAADLTKRAARTPWPADLRLIFTDGEELAGIRGYEEQGSYALGLTLRQKPGLEGFFTVLDMTGIGDTFVLGRAGEGLLHKSPTLVAEHPGLDQRFAFNRLHSRRILTACGQPQVEIETPFSDDLGFLMAGLPAVQISLLPFKEAQRFREARQATDHPAFPPAWQTMHSPDDTPDKLWPASFGLVRGFLEHLRDYPLPRA